MHILHNARVSCMCDLYSCVIFNIGYSCEEDIVTCNAFCLERRTVSSITIRIRARNHELCDSTKNLQFEHAVAGKRTADIPVSK